MSVLKVSGLTKNFGGLSAVSNVNMEIEQGEKMRTPDPFQYIHFHLPFYA